MFTHVCTSQRSKKDTIRTGWHLLLSQGAWQHWPLRGWVSECTSSKNDSLRKTIFLNRMWAFPRFSKYCWPFLIPLMPQIYPKIMVDFSKRNQSQRLMGTHPSQEIAALWTKIQWTFVFAVLQVLPTLMSYRKLETLTLGPCRSERKKKGETAKWKRFKNLCTIVIYSLYYVILFICISPININTSCISGLEAVARFLGDIDCVSEAGFRDAGGCRRMPKDFFSAATPDINGEELLSAGKLSRRVTKKTLREFRIPCGCIKKSP